MPFIIIIRIFTRKKFALNGQSISMMYLSLFFLFLIYYVYFILGSNNFSYSQLRHILFALISIKSSTGFFSADLSNYGHFLIFILILAGIIGGCTGSTAGGIKVFRIQVIYAMIRHHFLKILYPHITMNVKSDEREISNDTVSSIVILISLYIIALLIISAFMISSGFQIDESIASGVSFLSNSGVIATEYGKNTTIISNFSQSLRFICAFAMLLGRLEFVAIVIILIKIFRKD